MGSVSTGIPICPGCNLWGGVWLWHNEFAVSPHLMLVQQHQLQPPTTGPAGTYNQISLAFSDDLKNDDDEDILMKKWGD